MKTIIFSDNSLWTLIQFRGEIIKEFIADGYDVTIVAPYEAIDKDRYIANVNYQYVELNRTSKSIFQNLIYFVKIYKIYKREKPSIIFHYTIKPNILGSFAAKLLKIPTISIIPGLGYIFKEKNLLGFFSNLLLNKSLSFANFIFFSNGDDLQTLLNRKYKIANKSVVLPGGEGICLSKYTPLENYIPTQKRIFIMVARILWDKGYGEYIAAAEILKSRYPNTEFQLCGFIDTNYPTRVSKERIMSDHKSGTINYLGCLGDVRPHVKEATCVVLPSYYNEGRNTSLMESLAMGKPIITTDHQGCRELVKNGENGFIIKIKNVNELVNAMELIIKKSPEDLISMGKKSRRMAEDIYDIKDVYQIYKNHLHKILNNITN